MKTEQSKPHFQESSSFPSGSRRDFLLASSAFAAASLLPFPLCAAEDWKWDPEADIIPAPSDPALWEEFRTKLRTWREEARQRVNYNDALYERDDFAWVPSSFACCFLMLCDETFYDSQTGRYLVESFVEEARREFGGFDSVVLWHAYPRIGLDDRNQFDFYRDMPGGLNGLRKVVDELHHQGLKVYIDWNPWDTGTRREPQSDVDTLVDFVQALDVDGIFLDTLKKGTAEFRQKLDAAKKGVVLESELALSLDNIHDHHMSWAQGFADSPVPGVLRNKWFEPRHMQHQIARWNRDHTAELHTAWMNGSGMMIWENVFGSWVGWNERDRSILRAMLPIQRRYANLFSRGQWTPLVETLQPEVYASLWENDGLRLWTLVNRGDKEISGTLLTVPSFQNQLFFNLLQGVDAGSPPKFPADDIGMTLSGTVPPRGIACFLAGAPAVFGNDFDSFLESQNQQSSRDRTDTAFPLRETRLLPVPGTRTQTLPGGMVEIPAASFRMKSVFRIRECGFYESVHPHFAGPGGHKLHQPIEFEKDISLPRFAVDLTPVTNAQFAAFLKASGYRPKHPENFLKHWAETTPPSGKEDHPVVYVDLNDARAYAKWAGKRLPTEEEWQYAAQGPDGRLYPWGNEMQSGRCNAGETGGTTAVTAFPDGRSPFGLYDLCGNVWEWTESERSDGRTRFSLIKGGSHYRAQGSDWYTDGGPQTNPFVCKCLLMWPGLDRCATVGFRCAADLA